MFSASSSFGFTDLMAAPLPLAIDRVSDIVDVVCGVQIRFGKIKSS
jgi:hypothetical protein